MSSLQFFLYLPLEHNLSPFIVIMFVAEFLCKLPRIVSFENLYTFHPTLSWPIRVYLYEQKWLADGCFYVGYDRLIMTFLTLSDEV